MSCTIPKKLKIQRCFSNKDLKSLLSDFNINSRTSLKCSLFFCRFWPKIVPMEADVFVYISPALQKRTLLKLYIMAPVVHLWSTTRR